jgi:hypothetical protein
MGIEPYNGFSRLPDLAVFRQDACCDFPQKVMGVKN